MDKKIIATLLCIILLLSCTVTAFAENSIKAPADWVDGKNNIFKTEGKITLTPGSDSNDMNFAWVVGGVNKVKDRFVYSVNGNLSSPVEAEVITENNAALYYVSNKVSLKDLEKGVYYYSYTYNGMWQPVNSFEIYDDKDFSVMFCSDAQLGRSGDDSEEAVLNDAYAWNETLEAAKEKCPALSFCLSAGDQVNMALSEKQYNAFLYPKALRSLPIATAVGNHDFYSAMYDMRFNNPNKTENDLFSPAGNGYFFTYGNALFVVINTNNPIAEDHKALIATAINSNPDCKWRIVMMHSSLYFSGMDDDTTLIDLYAPIFEEFDIDLVLSGHEHVYSRTAPLTDNRYDENGVTYLAASTASGCNYDGYETTDARIVKNENCSEPSYSIINFGENVISVKSYFTESGEMFDEFVIEKAENTNDEVEYEYTAWYMHIIKLLITLIASIFKF